MNLLDHPLALAKGRHLNSSKPTRPHNPYETPSTAQGDHSVLVANQKRREATTTSANQEELSLVLRTFSHRITSGPVASPRKCGPANPCSSLVSCHSLPSMPEDSSGLSQPCAVLSISPISLLRLHEFKPNFLAKATPRSHSAGKCSGTVSRSS